MKPLLALTRPALKAGAAAAASLGYESSLLAAAPASQESSSSEVTTRQMVLFAITYIAYVAIYFARKPVSVCKSTLESEFGLTRAALGTIDTALLTAYAVGQFTLGPIVSVLGRDVMIFVGYAACGLFTAGFGFATSANQMAVLWGLCGFFAASINPLLVLYVADLFPASLRATAVGLWQTSQQVGGVAANTFASALLVASGWRSVFKYSGAIVAAFAPLLAVLLLSSKPAAAPSAARKAKPGGGAPAPKQATSPLSLPGVKSVGAAYTLVKMSRYCLMFWLPYFLTKQVGMSAASAAVMAALFDGACWAPSAPAFCATGCSGGR